MLHRLGFAVSILVVLCVLQSCSSGGDTTQPNLATDTTKTATTHFGKLNAKIRWGATGYGLFASFTIDSNGRLITLLPGDTLWCLSNGLRQGIPKYYDSLFSGNPIEMIDSGTYEFHFQRTAVNDTFSSVFTLPVIPFHVSAPADGSQVHLGNHTNDTIVYQPAGGTEVWIFLSSWDGRETVERQNSEPDNGKYGLTEAGYADGFIQLLRHFVGDLKSPAGFKSIHYDYWEKSKELKLFF
jgi:hypothetical protein